MLKQAANSLACARRGWVNTNVDKLECESCGAFLEFTSSATWTPSEGDFFCLSVFVASDNLPHSPPHGEG